MAAATQTQTAEMEKKRTYHTTLNIN